MGVSPCGPVLAIVVLSLVFLAPHVPRDALAQAATEIDRPSEAELGDALRSNLPPWWNLGDIAVNAVVIDGDAVPPAFGTASR
jgi:hypothetical protein